MLRLDQQQEMSAQTDQIFDVLRILRRFFCARVVVVRSFGKT